MPQPLINILTNLLTDRTNRVITNFGLTGHYSVQNGIDQGETITPLFWRIYYDPLITNISLNLPGYTMQTSWQTSLTSPSLKRLLCSTSVLAYMDDTLWIAQTKENLEKIIHTASSFYKMANIQVNPSKSVFIAKQTEASISFMQTRLTSIPPSQPFKFLGCWFTLNNKHFKQIKLIQEEALNLAYTANAKKITDKQIAYVINTVIIPTVEYRIHNIIMPQSTCLKILGKYLTIAKHKSNLSRSTPNSTMLNHNIYNIHNIWEIQLQHHSSNFLHRINNNSTLGTTTHIRLQQLQNNLWSTTNLLQHPQPIIDGPNKHTTTCKLIQLLQQADINLVTNSNLEWPQTIQDANLSIESILSKNINYRVFKQQLRKKHILYIEQLSSADNEHLLEWQHISPRLLHIPKGKKPRWFSILENTILDNPEYRTILPQFRPPGTNPFAYQSATISKKLKPWILTYQQDKIIIGQIRKRLKQTNSLSITHWQHDINIQHHLLYPLPSIICTPCPGCNLNSNRLPNYCTIEVSNTLSTQFLGRKTCNKQLKLNANYIDLLYSTAIKHPITLPPLPNIDIVDSLAYSLFQNNEACQQLIQLTQNNYNRQIFTFYTDRSVSEIGTSNCSMGVGWIQILKNQVINSFSARITDWPSSYKAELIAVLSAISTLPHNSKVDIFTDSQSIITKYKKLLHTPTESTKYFKLNYWPIWHSILNATKAFNIQLTFHKVPAHADNQFNNMADLLAKKHQQPDTHTLQFSHTNIYNPNFVIQWHKHYVEKPTRQFIKTIGRAKTIAMWSSQKCNIEWENYASEIEWNPTWHYINNNQKVTTKITSSKLNQMKAFRVKNLLNDLPTYYHLHTTFPKIYYAPTCFSCNNTDSTSHWLTCYDPQTLNKIVHSSINTIITKHLANSPIALIRAFTEIIKSHPSFNYPQHSLPHTHSLLGTLKGLISSHLVQTLATLEIQPREARDIIIQILLQISSEIYEQIWKPYCKKFAK